MGRRQVIDLPGMGHRAPISLGVRIDNILYTSGISGRDAETDSMPEDAAGPGEVHVPQHRADDGGSRRIDR